MFLVFQQIGPDAVFQLAKIIMSAKGKDFVEALVQAASSKPVKDGVLDASAFFSNAFQLKVVAVDSPQGVSKVIKTYHYFVTTGKVDSDEFGSFYSLNVLTHTPTFSHEFDLSALTGDLRKPKSLVELNYDTIIDSYNQVAKISIEKISNDDFGSKLYNVVRKPRPQYLVDYQIRIPEDWVERVEEIATSREYLASEEVAQKVKRVVGSSHIKQMILRILAEPVSSKTVTTVLSKKLIFLKI